MNTAAVTCPLLVSRRMVAAPDSETYFRAIFDECYPRIVDYARRRVPAHAVDDIVAATFLVIWRRIDDVPREAPLPWTYGVARRVIANQRRSQGRWQNLIQRLGGISPRATVHGLDLPDPEVAAAMSRLKPSDRGILALAYWEDLGPGEIGEVLGVSTNAATIRLHRARRRFAAAMGTTADARGGSR
jgi:RNA polymerase sigma-70 factor (ECF subfamily)